MEVLASAYGCSTGGCWIQVVGGGEIVSSVDDENNEVRE